MHALGSQQMSKQECKTLIKASIPSRSNVQASNIGNDDAIKVIIHKQICSKAPTHWLQNQKFSECNLLEQGHQTVIILMPYEESQTLLELQPQDGNFLGERFEMGDGDS